MSIDPDPPVLKRRRTRIVATLGPASRDPATVAELVGAGVDVFRLNLSHGDHAAHAEALRAVRAAARAAGRHVAVLGDLAGPKIRVGRFAGGGVDLVAGEAVTVTTRDVEGGRGLVPSRYEGLARDVRTGDRILLADGAMELAVESVEGTEVRCRVVQGGRLTDRKGINLPGVAVSAPCLTGKDADDARFLLDLGVDLLGLSFVRRAGDVAALRALIREAGGEAGIVAKIERPEALADIEAIAAAADAVMVARGDLGVELPPEQVPIVQRRLVDLGRRLARPVIVATQMLESMVESPRPTRAEVSDVSHAVASGADAVMLSAETASGAFPVEAVRMMDRIARQAEAYLWSEGAFARLALAPAGEPPLPFGDAVAHAMAQLSRDLRVRAVIAISQGGTSAATLSAARPAAPLVAVSPRPETCRRMALMWGVVPRLAPAAELADPPALARRLARELGLAGEGDYVLLVRGFAADPARNTPSITLLAVV